MQNKQVVFVTGQVQSGKTSTLLSMYQYATQECKLQACAILQPILMHQQEQIGYNLVLLDGLQQKQHVCLAYKNPQFEQGKNKRWLFNQDAFAQAQEFAKQVQVHDKLVIVLDEFGWEEAQGKGHAQAFAELWNKCETGLFLIAKRKQVQVPDMWNISNQMVLDLDTTSIEQVKAQIKQKIAEIT